MKKQCIECGSSNKVCMVNENPYCRKHYYQMQTYGKILKRTRRDKNEIILYDTYAEISIYDKNNEEKCRTIIDLDDVEKCKKYKWGYYLGYIKNAKHKIFLHSLVLNFKHETKGFVVDHINRNRLDNRKENLRVVSYQKNGINKGKQSNNTSGYPGVSWENRRELWEAHIKLNSKKKFLGYFNNLKDAINARKQAEIKYFKEIINRENDNIQYLKNQ